MSYYPKKTPPVGKETLVRILCSIQDFFRDELKEEYGCSLSIVDKDKIAELLLNTLQESAIEMHGDIDNPLKDDLLEVTNTCQNFAKSDEVIVIRSAIVKNWSDMEEQWENSHVFDAIYASGWSVVSVGTDTDNSPDCHPLDHDGDYIVLVRDVTNQAVSDVAQLQAKIGLDKDYHWNKQITDDAISYNDMHEWRDREVTPYLSSQVSPVHRQQILNNNWVSPHIDFPRIGQYPPENDNKCSWTIVPNVMFKCLVQQLDKTHKKKNDLVQQSREIEQLRMEVQKLKTELDALKQENENSGNRRKKRTNLQEHKTCEK